MTFVVREWAKNTLYKLSKMKKKLDKILYCMQEQLKLYRIVSMSQIERILNENLHDKDEKIIYELSDGGRSIRDIEKLSDASRSKIALLWKRWYRIGLMERSEKYEGKRMLKSFSLSDFGIEVEFPAESHQLTQARVEDFE